MSRLFTHSFVQAQIKESIQVPRHWPLWGEFTGQVYQRVHFFASLNSLDLSHGVANKSLRSLDYEKKTKWRTPTYILICVSDHLTVDYISLSYWYPTWSVRQHIKRCLHAIIQNNWGMSAFHLDSNMGWINCYNVMWCYQLSSDVIMVISNQIISDHFKLCSH